MLDDQWHHVVCRRQGQTLTFWVDGAVHQTKTDPELCEEPLYERLEFKGRSPWPDLRAYDRRPGGRGDRGTEPMRRCDSYTVIRFPRGAHGLARYASYPEDLATKLKKS